MSSKRPPKRTPRSSTSAPARKRQRGAAISKVGSSARKPVYVKEEVPSSSPLTLQDEQATLKKRFIDLFSESSGANGISNNTLKSKFGDDYPKLVPIINELTNQSRLNMSQIGTELIYTLVSEDLASKFAGLDISARMVYQVIEKAGNMGIWTKDVRTQTSIQQQTLTKIFKALETRRLIKPVKSVTAKSKKLYMLYNLTPAKELTGGPWYSDLEFDHEFITEMRKFLMQCVRRMNGGQGVTMQELRDKMMQAKVSRVELALEDVQELVQTLLFDHLIESVSTNVHGDNLFVATRKVTTMCEFKWWDALLPDFHFREIVFEDGVRLSAHEPHHHTGS